MTGNGKHTTYLWWNWGWFVIVLPTLHHFDHFAILDRPKPFRTRPQRDASWWATGPRQHHQRTHGRHTRCPALSFQLYRTLRKRPCPSKLERKTPPPQSLSLGENYILYYNYIYSWKWSIKDVRRDGARELWGSQVGGNLTWVAQRLGPRLPEISRCQSLPGWSPWDSAKRALTPWPFWTYAGIHFYLSSFIHVYPSIHPFTHGSNHPFVVDLTTQSWSDSQGGRLTKDGEWWLGESSPNTNDLIFSLLNYFEFSKIYGFIMRVLSQIPSR